MKVSGFRWTALALVALVAAGASLVGCESTTRYYRRTSWTLGSYEPLRVGDALQRGEFRAEVALEGGFPHEQGDAVAVYDESALYVNRFAGTLSFFGAPVDELELGGGLTLAAPSWSKPTSAAAVGPTPEGTIGRAAAGIRGNLPVADAAAHVSVLANLGVQWGRTDRWECETLLGCQAVVVEEPDTSRGSATLDAFLGIHGDYDVHPLVTPYVYLGMGFVMANDAIVVRGADESSGLASGDRSIYPDMIGMTGFGADLKVGPGRFRVGMMVPFGGGEHGLGPSLTASVGVIGGRVTTEEDATDPASR